MGGVEMITTPLITRVDGGQNGRHYRVEGFSELFPSVTNVLGVFLNRRWSHGPGTLHCNQLEKLSLSIWKWRQVSSTPIGLLLL